MTDADADIVSVVRSQFHATLPPVIGVAVSGGGDSVALLHILTRCFPRDTVRVEVATVDHGLRPEAAAEAEAVAALAAELDVSHSILRWTGWDGKGNLQAVARDARYRLLGEWARSRKIPLVTLAHTADDQAETVLMRLARSAGVSGLAAMPARRTLHGVSFLRPLLGVTRSALRSYLRRNHLNWIEDPSNSDLRFERVQARQVLSVLSPLGITAESLATVAGYMSDAREALDWYTFLTAREIAAVNHGDIVIDLRRFRTQPDEIARRLLSCAIMWVGRGRYPPRRAALKVAIAALRFGRGTTLNGCQVTVSGASIWIGREYNAVREKVSEPGHLWDDRWRMTGPVAGGDTRVAALGRPGLGQLPDWRTSGRPHAILMATPAIWDGDTLVAAPLAGLANGWRAELQQSAEAFFATLLSN